MTSAATAPADLIGSGGVAGAVVVALGYILWYLIKRRGSETGVVETTRETLKLVRDDQKIMGDEMRKLRLENVDLRSELRQRGQEVDDLETRNDDLAEHVERLEKQNTELRARLERLENVGSLPPPQATLPNRPPDGL